MQQFPYRTHTTVAQVVDVVNRADAVLQVKVGRNGRNDVVYGDVLVAKLVDKRTEFLLLFFRGNGVFAEKNFVEYLMEMLSNWYPIK